MKSPWMMNTIQIQITNACSHNCSNCTRFCGWHEKSFFMDYDTFKKAVDSLEGYEGMVGIMGGEPTLHPQFDRFVDYLNSKVKEQKKINSLIIPETDISKYRDNNQNDVRSRKGIFSCAERKYYEHFQQIQDSFRYQCLNDHKNTGDHQALLVARKDLQIGDRQFQVLRDKCWINNMWSASITPKGCFFCEIAAAMDMLFDGEGGLPIEKGWYLRRPEDFNSYKAKNKRYELFTVEEYNKGQGKLNQCLVDPYIETNMDRIDKYDNELKPYHIDICFIDQKNKIVFDENKKYCFDVDYITFDEFKYKKFEDWCLVIKNNCNIDFNIFQRIYNPGVLYINQDYYFVNRRASSLNSYNIDINTFQNDFIEDKKCYVGKFHVENENIKYSFLMPTYNASKTVEKAIQSILNQNYSNFNIYFCDDASTDNTVQILNKYKEKDERIKQILINKINSSALISRNRLIDAADGDYIIWVDADDEVNDNICAFSTWLLNKERFQIIDFPFEIIDHSKDKNSWCPLIEYYHRLYNKDVYDFFATKMRSPMCLWSKIIDTNLAKKSRVQDNSVYLVDDNVIVYPLYYNCKSFLSVNSQKMYKYNYGFGNWGKDSIDLYSYMKNCQSILKAWNLNYKFIIQHNPKFKYIKRLIDYANLSYPTTELMRVNQNSRIDAMSYSLNKFNFIKNFIDYINNKNKKKMSEE